MTAPLLLEPLTEADHAALIGLVNRAYRGTGPVRGWNVEDVIVGERLNAARLGDDLAAKPDATILIHRGDGDAPIGSVMLEPGAHGRWHLGLLAIEPALQAGGMGRRMLAAAEDHAHARGARTIEMAVVSARDTLIAWYERRGYARTGATRPWPYADERFGRALRDDLCFVMLEKALAR